MRAILGWTALIMVLSLMPRMSSLMNPQDENGLNQGPLAHLSAYSVLAAMLTAYMIIKGKRHPAIRACLLAGSYGALVEFAQYFTPTRSCDPYDILINLAAAALGVTFFKLAISR